jgi:F0F1-type ATP synthase assembly protein I
MDSHSSPPATTPEQKGGFPWTGVALVWELGWIIAIPVLIFGFGGAYLDKRWNTAPWFLIAGFAVSFLLSVAAAIQRVREYIRVTHTSN